MPDKGDTESDPPGTGEEGRKPPFKFNMIGIETGETVTFVPTDVDVKVVSDRKVEYEGKKYTLAEFTRKFMPEDKRNASDAYQGPKYFTYKGCILDDIRERLQK